MTLDDQVLDRVFISSILDEALTDYELVILLAHLMGVPQTTIASVCDTPTSTISDQIAVAMTKLRLVFEDQSE